MIDAIVLFMSIIAFNNLITRRSDLLGIKFLLKSGLTLIQFFILLILVIKIGRTNKKTRLKLGKITVAPHWVFLSGIIGIKVFSTIFEWIVTLDLFSLSENINTEYFLIFHILFQSFTLTLYYILMKKNDHKA